MRAAKRKIPEDYRPSEDEPFMSERQRAYFRRKLLNWRDEILRSTKETLQHLHDDSAQHAHGGVDITGLDPANRRERNAGQAREFADGQPSVVPSLHQ